MRFSRVLFVLGCLVIGENLHAGPLEVTVTDPKGGPIANAVVYATGHHSGRAENKKQVIIDQRNKQFVPYVTAVQVGTSISFPNKDNIRHHVYSLSPAKKFELPLYAGVPAAPVLFDKEGFVTLGCNIHDWMVAYVAVLTTPYFEVSGQGGHVTLKGLPAGNYTIKAWHPLLNAKPEQLAQQLEVTAHGTQHLSFTLNLKPDFRSRRAPGLSTGGYP